MMIARRDDAVGHASLGTKGVVMAQHCRHFGEVGKAMQTGQARNGATATGAGWGLTGMASVIEAPTGATTLIGDSVAMAAVRQMVALVARGDASVLVTGPSGSGKERVARAIHADSDRATGPFVAINCGAIPRELLESELFGHEKGAFTGAVATRTGRFEEAQGGTLFLDEIGDMPADMQVKLLRVLEERTVTRVGGRGEIAVDVRIISATHRDLGDAIDEGRFREDLYYRLAVFPIALPSLAERVDDLAMLIGHFAGTSRQARTGVRFASDALTRLAAHPWPGNLRELRNMVERAAILHPGETIGAADVDRLLSRSPLTRARTLKDAHLPGAVIGDGDVDLNAILAAIEARYIAAAMARANGVVAEAAAARAPPHDVDRADATPRQLSAWRVTRSRATPQQSAASGHGPSGTVSDHSRRWRHAVAPRSLHSSPPGSPPSCRPVRQATARARRAPTARARFHGCGAASGARRWRRQPRRSGRSARRA